MSVDLPDRLARRRRELRQRQLRRRRLLLGVGLLAIAAVAVFVITSRGSNPDKTSSSKQVAAKETAGGGSDKAAGTAAGAQPDSSWKPSKAPVPILMYHVIGEPADGVNVPYPELYLSAGDFRDQVDWLDQNGYTAVTLIQVQDAWDEGGALPKKPVVLSFDDGYLGQYTDAMPTLRKKGWAGQLNLKSEGSDLSSAEVKKMVKAGWEIASHSITHPDLTTLSGAALRQELVGSKDQLEKDLGVKVENFCYPAGVYNDEVVAAVEAAGYRGATTVDPGLAERSEPFTLKRIRINRGDSADTLATDLENNGA
ncbi:MAG: polysaccharide deacetylase family protein [Solirubrobacterales bacterium]|nr:polysaccharide deacetylase family protein [Solirubrobacterales bacterium]